MAHRDAGPEPGLEEAVRRPRRRSRLRALVSTGTLLVVGAPIAVHVMRMDAADAPAATESGPRTYYLSPDGDDLRDGTSPATAWQSLERADAAFMIAGDRLRLRGGASFRGSFGLGPGEANDPAAPVVIESYGDGRATIEAVGYSGIHVHNTGGVEVRNLTLVGDEDAFAGHAGIRFSSDLSADRKLDHVYVSNVEVTNFQAGVAIDGLRGGTGFRDVRVSDSVLHGNRDAGLISKGPAFTEAGPVYAHEAVSVSAVEAYENRGNPVDRWNTTGNGIVLGSVRGGVIERSVAHDNGSLCDSERGPVGIWAYDSTKIAIQRNLAYHNRTAGVTDGGGFDLDRHVSDSVVQYNLSYENEGSGILIYGPPKDGPVTNSVVRFNISDNDARKHVGHAGIMVGGATRDLQIYHNTVVTRPNPSGVPAALKVYGYLDGLTVRNNILVTEEGPAVLGLSAFKPEKVTLQGNDIFNPSTAELVRWGSRTYSTLESWRNATDQERLGSTDTGLSTDPRFISAEGRGGPAVRANGFALTASSLLVKKALDLRSLFGVDPGPQDYFGTPLSNSAAIGSVQSTGTR